jgi:hypothetical protein
VPHSFNPLGLEVNGPLGDLHPTFDEQERLLRNRQPALEYKPSAAIL